MSTMPMRLSLALALATTSATAALAQSYTDPRADAEYQQRAEDYSARQQDYQSQQQDYDAAAAAARANRDTYDVQRDRYAHDKAAYERERADYDARYGEGAWARRYADASRRDHDDRAPPPCERDSHVATDSALGALAGAAVGAGVAGRGNHTEGAVLGGLAGAAIGAAAGADSTPRCDSRGYYFTFNQTYPYRERWGDRGRSSGRYDYDAYRRMGCRLSAAPAYTDGDLSTRYVRVCPDDDRRYRITG